MLNFLVVFMSSDKVFNEQNEKKEVRVLYQLQLSWVPSVFVQVLGGEALEER